MGPRLLKTLVGLLGGGGALSQHNGHFSFVP